MFFPQDLGGRGSTHEIDFSRMMKGSSRRQVITTLFIVMLSVFSCNNKPIYEDSTTSVKTTSPIAQEIHSSNDFQMKLWQKGIDFYARGNEPHWALDMDFEKSFHFKTLDGIEIIVPPENGSKAMDARVIRYKAEAEAGMLIVTIQEEKCQDSMADEVFNFSVRIQVKSASQDNFDEFEGCGNYVPDYRLHDIWILENFNGKDLKTDLMGKELPRFEFFAKEGKVLGFTGCNEFNGKYDIVGKGEIQFYEAAMTKKMCPDLKIENILSKSMFGKRMKYDIQNLKLKFTGYDGSEFIFKKVD